MTVEVIQAWSDNYTYIVFSSDCAFLVDPPDAESVLCQFKAADLELKQILVTHHHADHTGGCQALRDNTGCQVIGPAGGGSLIDRVVGDGDELHLNGLKVSAISVPGHTDSDMAYWLPEEKIVFTGDTLFAGGCGRLFGGSAETMWKSLTRLRELPDDTLIYCGHEYTVENLRFAHKLEPENVDVSDRLELEQAKRSRGEATVPSSMGLEKITNPFLRCDTEEVASAVNMSGADAWQVFAKIREMKNAF